MNELLYAVGGIFIAISGLVAFVVEYFRPSEEEIRDQLIKKGLAQQIAT